MTDNIEIEPSSFRDPDASVYIQNGEIYRKINKSYVETFNRFISSGLYQKLLSKNLIIEHSSPPPSRIEEIIIKPKAVFITYPWEWCFSQLKDAALALLEIQKIALEFDMVLKDASPFNIQFVENKPLLIDTTSFEEFQGKPWSAYRQFCENFLAPLSLIAYKDLSLSNLFLGSINGISLNLASKLLPFKTRFNLDLLIHIHLHAKMCDKYSKNDKKIESCLISKEQMLKIIDNLYRAVLNINLSNYKTEWQNYYSNTNYSDESFKNKKEIIDSFKKDLPLKTVLDLGANTGFFSRIFSKEGIKTFSFDIDRLAVEKNYLTAKKENEKNIFPLVFDIMNPSCSSGFDNKERKALKERLREVDLVLALALIHHLRFTNNLPLEHISNYFSKIAKYLIIEFVDKEDSKVQTMLLNRKDIFSDYSEENFEKVFSKKYQILSKKQVLNSKRTLYLMRRSDVE